MIELKCDHSSATGRRNADDVSSGIVPGKMFAPDLKTRIEEGNKLICGGIQCLRLCAFEFIAGAAGNPKIVFFGSSTGGSWNDVIEREADSCESFRSEAIAATIVGQFSNLSPYFCERFRHAHLGRGIFVNAGKTRPRHFNNAYAYALRNINLSLSKRSAWSCSRSGDAMVPALFLSSRRS